jgi:hypothetical protein
MISMVEQFRGSGSREHFMLDMRRQDDGGARLIPFHSEENAPRTFWRPELPDIMS